MPLRVRVSASRVYDTVRDVTIRCEARRSFVNPTRESLGSAGGGPRGSGLARREGETRASLFSLPCATTHEEAISRKYEVLEAAHHNVLRSLRARRRRDGGRASEGSEAAAAEGEAGRSEAGQAAPAPAQQRQRQQGGQQRRQEKTLGLFVRRIAPAFHARAGGLRFADSRTPNPFKTRRATKAQVRRRRHHLRTRA